MAEKINPLIKKKETGLKQKDVTIAGTNDFSRFPVTTTPKEEKKSPKTEATPLTEKELKWLSPIKTQRVSDDVALKINSLKPFLANKDNLFVDIGVQKNDPNFNDIVNFLVDNYTNNNLSNRDLETYKSVYHMLRK